MIKKTRLSIILPALAMIAAALPFITSCRPNTFTLEDDYMFVDLTEDFRFTVDLESDTKDVYFLFTNVDQTNKSTLPSVIQSIESRSLYSGPEEPAERQQPGLTQPLARRGVETIAEMNNSADDFGERTASRSLSPAVSFDTAASGSETTGTFRAYDTYNNYIDVPSTCRAVVPDENGRTLNIWVADNCWEGYSGGDKADLLVNSTMVNALAEKFLKAGDNNDIYEWITDIFGDEWGSHPYSNLITPNNEITILLYDIDGDGLEGTDYDNDPSTYNAYIVGLYDSTHNLTVSTNSNSNQRIMFFLDAVLYSADADTSSDLPTSDSSDWAITDYWPAEVVSTLAHEFQHMIHFYQKNVLRGGTPDTWLNEMCSVIAEDFVADKMAANGPRGVDYFDGTAGDPFNTEGRMPEFNAYNDFSLTTWNYSTIDYAMVYSFGAFLARNYGGVELFRNIVQNSGAGVTAVEDAVAEVENETAFEELLKLWAVAVVWSDDTNASDTLQYNVGDYFTSSAGGETYNLGSINLYNYRFQAQNGSYDGPWFYTPGGDELEIGDWDVHYATATAYYLAGENLTGKNTWEVSLPEGIELTVVLK